MIDWEAELAIVIGQKAYNVQCSSGRYRRIQRLQ